MVVVGSVVAVVVVGRSSASSSTASKSRVVTEPGRRRGGAVRWTTPKGDVALSTLTDLERLRPDLLAAVPVVDTVR